MAAAEAIPGKCIGHALAVVGIGARHRRQILHRDMSGDLAGTNALLDGFGKLFHQSQSARDPAQAAIKPACQILQAVAEALLQLLKQPTLFQRCFLFGQAHRTIQDQGIRFVHVPDDGLHRVLTQLLQSRHPFVAVDDQIPIRVIGNRHDHNRRLLSRGCQGCQQPPLSFRIPNAQMLITAVELMKLQLHWPFPLRQSLSYRLHLGLRGPAGKYARKL